MVKGNPKVMKRCPFFLWLVSQRRVVLFSEKQEVDVSRRRKDDFLKELVERKMISIK